MKVIVNKCFGGFGFSHEATLAIAKAKGVEVFAYKDDFTTGYDSRVYNKMDNPTGLFVYYSTLNKPVLTKQEINENYFRVENLSDDIRTDADAIRIVEEMGEKSWGNHAELKIIEIPDGIEYEIDDYDGVETIHEKHRSW